ncbi:MAG: T9SS type A sorting domain-containing protein, partial [Ignavibacteriota bacterium]
TKNNFLNGDTIAFARFLLYPQKDPCADVTFDSLKVHGGICSILSNDSTVAHLCSTIGCGTATLSRFLRYGAMPQFILSPNPSTSAVTLTSTKSINNVRMQISDAMGVIKEDRIIQINISQPIQFDVGHLASGIYFLRLVDESFQTVIPFVHY